MSSSSLPPPPTPLDPAAAQWVRDVEHLRLLSIFHYITGGLAIFFSCFFLLYVVFGIVLATNLSHPPLHSQVRTFQPANPTPLDTPPPPAAAPSPAGTTAPFNPGSPRPTPFNNFHPDQPGPPAAIGFILAGVGAVVVLIGWTVGALLIYSGRGLARHTGRTFSMVIAGLSCLQVPFGTILGVFTLLVLSRPSIVALYAADGRK